MVGKRLPPRIDKICGLKLPKIKRLLDVGCGDGKYALAFQKAFGIDEFFGIDMGEEAVKMAGSSSINMSCMDLNKTGMPYQDNYFDMVFAGEIIEHLLSPDNLLIEVHRVLRSGGYFVVTTPNIANWYDRIILLVGWQPYSIPTHSVCRGVGTFMSKARDTTIRDYRYIFTTSGCGLAHIQFFTYRSLKALMKMHGFEVLNIWGISAEQFTFPINSLIRKVAIRMDSVISNLFVSLASGLVVVARVKKDE